MKQQGKGDFSHEMYEDMKSKAQQEKTVRDKIDPEFDEAFRKLNLNRLYEEFLARPMRNQPDELHDQIMQPLHLTKMSKRDIARGKFARDHRLRMKSNKTFKNRIIQERERIMDF